MASRIVNASFWAIVGGAAQNAITFVILIYLAHVLHPRDFGLMSIVMVGIDLGGFVTRWGQTELLQQRRYESDTALQASFRLTIVVSLVIACGFLIAAAPMGRAYHSPQLVVMMALCAPIFLLTGAGAVPEALIRRELRFRLLATRNTVTNLIGGCVAIALVYAGFGAISLAVQRLVQALTIQIWNWSNTRWRPARTLFASRVPGLFQEGSSVMLGTILPLLVPRSVDLIVGATLGPASLGLMRIAFRVYDFLSQIVIMPLVTVANSQFGRASVSSEALQRLYLRFTQISSSLICPLLIGLGLVADRAVPLLFGAHWKASIELVQIVSITGLIAPINYFFTTAMVSAGQSHRAMRQGIFQLVIGVIISGVAIHYSITAVVMGNVLRATITSIYNLIDLRRYANLKLKAIFGIFLPTYCGVAMMAVLITIFKMHVPANAASIPVLVEEVAIGGLAYVLTTLLGEWLGWWSGYVSLFQSVVLRRHATADAVS